MKNFIKLLVIVLIVSNVNSCKSSKNVIKTEDKEVEILIPCSGDKYRSDKNYIRANSMGESQDMTLAKKESEKQHFTGIGK